MHVCTRIRLDNTAGFEQIFYPRIFRVCVLYPCFSFRGFSVSTDVLLYKKWGQICKCIARSFLISFGNVKQFLNLRKDFTWLNLLVAIIVFAKYLVDLWWNYIFFADLWNVYSKFSSYQWKKKHVCFSHPRKNRYSFWTLLILNYSWGLRGTCTVGRSW
jgi:hypothetical protein